jgi:hypothetical protein
MARKDVCRGQLNEKIKEVAQCLYEKRGRVPGHELDDWLEAEKIVKRECQIGISKKC